MVRSSSPNFGEKESRTAKIAATQYAAVENTRVAVITPMFSPYVVVAEPPAEPAIIVARPSAKRVLPVASLISGGLVWFAIERKWPTVSAMSTSTTGRNIGKIE